MTQISRSTLGESQSGSGGGGWYRKRDNFRKSRTWCSQIILSMVVPCLLTLSACLFVCMRVCVVLSAAKSDNFSQPWWPAEPHTHLCFLQTSAPGDTRAVWVDMKMYEDVSSWAFAQIVSFCCRFFFFSYYLLLCCKATICVYVWHPVEVTTLLWLMGCFVPEVLTRLSCIWRPHIHTRRHIHTHTHSCIAEHQLPQLWPHTSGSAIPTKWTKTNLSWNLSPQLLCTELPGRTMLQVRSWTGFCHSLAGAQWSPVASSRTGSKSSHRWTASKECL